jgi:hypothetical protein
MPPAPHNPSYTYTYVFAIHRDLGPHREMPWLRNEAVVGVTRRDAVAKLKLAADERAVWAGVRHAA